MSLHFILDGYNILHKFSFPQSRSLEDQRELLIRFLQERRPQGSVNNKVTVVFDGRPEHFGGHPSQTVRVIFTDGETADEKIKKMVADMARKGHIVVVTDDREIIRAVRSEGAQVESVQSFISRRTSSGASGSGPKGKQISPDVQRDINDELKRIWLKE